MSVGSVGPQNKKSMDFELNLIPFIDLLSVCICFLLITAVWTQIGTLNTKQSVGAQTAASNDKKPLLNVSIDDLGNVTIEAKDSKISGKNSVYSIAAVSGRPHFAQIAEAVSQMRGNDPEILTALVQPKAATMYEDIIELMDQFKKGGIINLGVNPL